MRVAVCIVSFDCADHVVKALQSLRASRYRPSVVHVCENAGSVAFGTLKAAIARGGGLASTNVSAVPATDIVEQAEGTLDVGGIPFRLHCAGSNLGYAGGVNLCIRSLEADAWDAILILNPDIQLDDAAIGALVAHGHDERYGIIGCRMLFAETGRVQMYGCRWRPWIGRVVNLGLNQPGDVRPDVAAVERQTDFVCGAVMYITRRYIETAGLMDESYFLYMEEVDYCFRRGALRLGYAHDAIAIHAHGATTGASRDATKRSPLTIYLGERNKLRFTRRFFPLRYPVVVLTTLVFTGVYLKRGGVAAFRVALAGWWAGILCETGHPRRLPR